MKKLLLLPLLLTMFTSAEIYEDFTPSQEPMELTVVAVQPNYVDTYLTNLNRTWVRACLLYTSPSPRDLSTSRMPSSA